MPKVLIVEDNEMNRTMLVRRLARHGFEVVEAADGREALTVARAGHPDVVLMDMSLPVMDGWEATRTLKTDPETRAIPIIGLTAHAMAEDRSRAMAAGCDEYETKPIELPRLIAKIKKLAAGPAES